MAGYSLEELRKRMEGKSITLGWDAVVSMNRTKVNTLLKQQYIERFSQDSYLPLISGRAKVANDEVLELKDLMLSYPQLSFENGTLEDSKVKATLEVISGTATYIREGTPSLPEEVLYTESLSPNLGFTLTVDINLRTSKGSVEEQGKVIVNFADGVNWSCNIAKMDSAQKKLGEFFADIMLKEKNKADLVYVLGMLDLKDIHALAPDSFLIRTMSTPTGMLLGADDYGDGAVVLFIKTKDSENQGSEPRVGSMDYLIPNDTSNGVSKYSGSLVLAHQLVMDSFLKPGFEAAMPGALRLERLIDNVTKSISYRAIKGAAIGEGFYKKYTVDRTLVIDGYLQTVGQASLEYAGSSGGSGDSLTIFLKHGEFILDWPVQKGIPFEFELRGHGSEDYDGNIKFKSPLQARYTLDVKSDSLNEVYFVPDGFVFKDVSVDYSELDKSIDDADEWNLRDAARQMLEYRSGYKDVESWYVDFLDHVGLGVLSIKIDSLNLLSVSNLLFPGRNVLRLTEAYMPGDLLTVGHIDPKETSYAIDPPAPRLKAGTQQQFTFKPLGLSASEIKWHVRAIDQESGAGSITQNGLYTAPSVESFPKKAVRVVVTAEEIDSDTKAVIVTSSALVTIVERAVVVTPSLTLVDMEKPVEITLDATSLNGSTYTWTLLNGAPGKLTDAKGAVATYNPVGIKLEPGELRGVEIQVEDSKGEKAVAFVLLRSGSFTEGLRPAYKDNVPLNGQVKIEFTEAGYRRSVAGDKEVKLEWEIVHGGGSFDPWSQIYTAPSEYTSPFSIVKVSYSVGKTYSGYSVIGLSENQQESAWTSLDVFKFEASTATVYHNGLQQALVRVIVKPTDVDNMPVTLSDSELDSIRLVSASGHDELPAVKMAGLEPNEKWHYTSIENSYLKYPTTMAMAEPEIRPAGEQVRTFYVQCYHPDSLRIAARLTKDGSNKEYYSAQPGDELSSGKIMELVAKAPPVTGGGASQIILGEPVRIEGEANELDMTTLDYYDLSLILESKPVQIRQAKFQPNFSMVQWESDTAAEEFHSITGYAIASEEGRVGATPLHIENTILRNLQSQDDLPKDTVDITYPLLPGRMIFSLQRREYWRYDKAIADTYGEAIQVNILDAYGTAHTFGIKFNGRDKLALVV